MDDIFAEIVRIRREGGKCALATIVRTRGSTPAPLASKLLIRGDGTILGTVGGGCVEGEVLAEAQEVLREERPRFVSYSLTDKDVVDGGLICGGAVDVYIEPIIADHTAILFGGGHVSLWVSRVAKLGGFRVVVVDDREDFANRERFPEADEVICAEFAEAFGQLPVTPSSYIIIVTRGHQYDQDVLEWAVGTPARYVGMIGSRTKVTKIFHTLRSKGVPEAALKRVDAPIGIDIGARTPEEIAVSIVAKLIEVRRGGPSGRKQNPLLLAESRSRKDAA